MGSVNDDSHGYSPQRREKKSTESRRRVHRSQREVIHNSKGRLSRHVA
jgi:hypothetical protein